MLKDQLGWQTSTGSTLCALCTHQLLPRHQQGYSRKMNAIPRSVVRKIQESHSCLNKHLVGCRSMSMTACSWSLCLETDQMMLRKYGPTSSRSLPQTQAFSRRSWCSWACLAAPAASWKAKTSRSDCLCLDNSRGTSHVSHALPGTQV